MSKWIEQAQAAVDNTKKQKSTYLFGTMGTGKTLLAKTIQGNLQDVPVLSYNRDMEVCGDNIECATNVHKRYASGERQYELIHTTPFHNISFYQVQDLLESIKNGFGGGEKEENIVKARCADLLILDDIGAEKISEWSVNIFNLILSYRMDNNLPTLFTSNYSLEALEERYSAYVDHTDAKRLMERIKYDTLVLEFNGANMRKKERTE